MEESMSDLQRKIFEFVKQYISENSFPPTVREICCGTGIKSTSTVHLHLKNLSERGLLKYKSASRRAISIPGSERKETLSIPLVGDVAAGTPIMAVENIIDCFEIPTSMLHGGSTGEVFMLKICGDSMIETGILNGDMIIVNNALSVNNGDIAVVRVFEEGEIIHSATVKRFFREKDRVRLQPENSSMQPIYADYNNIEIVGKVIGLIRNL